MRERLKRLLHREANAVRLGHRELLALPVDERVERGECLSGLAFLGEERGEIRLRCAENLSKWRAGDPLALRNGDGSLGLRVRYVSFDPAEGRLTVRRDPFDREGSFDPAGSLQLDPVEVSLHDMAIRALDTLESRRDGEASIALAVIDGKPGRSIDPSDERFAERYLASSRLGTLDPWQRAAFMAAVSKRPVSLVQGPPGSGKTRLLASVVSALAERGDRLLVTAYTHRAVNNALREIAAVDPRCLPVKVGPEHGADDLAGSAVVAVRRIGDAPPGTRGRPRVVGATIFGVPAIAAGERFDRVLCDEAAQIPIAYAACALQAAGRHVLVGDHKQMGPIVQGRHDDDLAVTSLFEHLIPAEDESDLKPERALLRTTWRMNDGINAFPSRCFYGGQLEPHADAAARRFPLVPGGPFDDILDPGLPAVVATVHHEGFRTRCEPEARAVADLVADLLIRQRLAPGDVAVVSPFRAQIREIRTLLQRALRPAGKELPVVDTVERIQGQEREAVVVSLAASDPEHLSGEQAAFFFSPNRLNVTLTRARTKLVLVASRHLFRALPPAFDDLRNADLFRRLYRELPRVDLTSRYIG